MRFGLQKLLILSSKLGYQTRAFADAARRAGAEVQLATDRCHRLDDPWGDAAIPVHFAQAEEAAAEIVEELGKASTRVDGILALGDAPVPSAAHAARALGLAFHSPDAVANCRSKLRQHEVLGAAGLPVPEFFAFGLRERLDTVLPRVKFPCVIKPLGLAASQGVIRADNAEQFARAVARNRALLESPEVRASREPGLDQMLCERFIEGDEVAVEALLTRSGDASSASNLRVLAVFDKPEQSQGPFFEEYMYATPSRLPALALASVTATLRVAATALGLTHGPLHCEFRVTETGPVILEIHPRPIGGLCARALRFVPPPAMQENDNGEAQSEQRSAEAISLEDLLVRHALGLPGADWPRERAASGVMMIPVPQSGMLEDWEGEADARAVRCVTEVHITARRHDYVAAWPEGSSYLGFIFARAEEPEEVVAALKAAHGDLQFKFSQTLPMMR